MLVNFIHTADRVTQSSSGIWSDAKDLVPVVTYTKLVASADYKNRAILVMKINYKTFTLESTQIYQQLIR